MTRAVGRQHARRRTTSRHDEAGSRERALLGSRPRGPTAAKV